jgi:WD40 repeat protein
MGGGHQNLTCLALSPDGKRLASGSRDWTVKVWDTATGQETWTLQGHAGPVYSVAFSPDGKRLASGGRDLKVWDAATGHQTLTLKGHSGLVSSVAFSPDGKRLASGTGDQHQGEVKVWDAATGQETLTLKGDTGGVTDVAFSPDGKLLAGATWGSVMVWDAATGQETLTLNRQFSRILSDEEGMCSNNSVAFSPDGKRLASGSYDGSIKVWDAQTGRETLTLKERGGARQFGKSVAFSPDGRRLAGDSVLLDAQTGEALIALPQLGCDSHVIFSPDGNLLVGYYGGGLLVWNGTPLE